MNEQLSSQTDKSSPDVIGELLGKILGSQIGNSNNQPTTDASHTPTSSQEESGTAPFGDIFSSILSSPDLLLKLPSVISAAKPIIDILSQSHKAAEIPDRQASSIVTEVSRPQASPASHGRDHRTALLCAMKPYLSDDRQRAIDYILKLSRLGDILKTL